MNKLYECVDDNPKDDDRSFSGRRVVRLFVAIMASSIIAGVPLGLWKLAIEKHKREEAERQKQEQLDKDWQELRKAARDGKTGEAFRRLFDAKPEGNGK